MSTIELRAYSAPPARRNALAHTLQGFRAWLRQRREERTALWALARLDTRLLTDIGFVPREVYAAAGGDALPSMPERAAGWSTAAGDRR